MLLSSILTTHIALNTVYLHFRHLQNYSENIWREKILISFNDGLPFPSECILEENIYA